MNTTSTERQVRRQLWLRHRKRLSLHLKVLLKTDYEHIEQNNLQQFYEQIFDMGYSPGRTFGKVLVSAQEQELTNFYEAWIELISE